MALAAIGRDKVEARDRSVGFTRQHRWRARAGYRVSTTLSAPVSDARAKTS
jgi:hypothetical protein